MINWNDWLQQTSLPAFVLNCFLAPLIFSNEMWYSEKRMNLIKFMDGGEQLKC